MPEQKQSKIAKRQETQMQGGGCHTTIVVLLDERSNDAVQKSFCIQAIASLEVLSLYWKVKCKMEGLSDLWTYVVFTHIVKGIYLR